MTAVTAMEGDKFDTIDTILARLKSHASVLSKEEIERMERERVLERRIETLSVALRVSGFPDDLAIKAHKIIQSKGLEAGHHVDVTRAFVNGEIQTIGLRGMRLHNAPELYATYLAACLFWRKGIAFGYLRAAQADKPPAMHYSYHNIGTLVISAAEDAQGFVEKKIAALTKARQISCKRTIITMYDDLRNDELLKLIESSGGIISIE